jgi:Domain of Unknown Function (DUF1080)
LCGGGSKTPFRFLPPTMATNDLVKKWFAIEAIADGDELRVKVDGKQTVHSRAYLSEVREGAIALELCAESTTVRFRNLEVRRLPAATAKPTQFESMLNGKDLTNWTLGTPPGDWKYENGVLTTVPGGQAGGIRYQGADLHDFHLRCEMKQTGSLMQFAIRSEGERQRDWGYLVFLGANGRILDRHNKTPTPFTIPDSLVFQQGEWYTWEIIATGADIRVLVNGIVLAQYHDPGPQLVMFGQLAINTGATKQGRIARPTEIRKLEVRRLP